MRFGISGCMLKMRSVRQVRDELDRHQSIFLKQRSFEPELAIRRGSVQGEVRSIKCWRNQFTRVAVVARPAAQVVLPSKRCIQLTSRRRFRKRESGR